jgi:hypothetical protein
MLSAGSSRSWWWTTTRPSSGPRGVFPRITPQPEAAVHAGGEVAGPMLRKGSPLLEAELAAFVKTTGRARPSATPSPGSTRGAPVS